ncbi:hypothetical protein MUP00_00285, partial [Candidatus Bathyarchaeota archaeon]|nr:hypothetical protein [Candidatus Bathyarchaeota archaeon]
RLSQEEYCQLDSLFINLEIPLYDSKRNEVYTESERFRLLLEVLAPRVESWHWLKWSRVTLDDDGCLKTTRHLPHSSDDEPPISSSR